MLEDLLTVLFVVSTIAAVIVMAVAPAFLKSTKDLKKASVNLHGQGR